jgi:2-methylfumaryl-CoA isomerase
MTAGPLQGLRIVEGSAFVAAPLAGMTLAQLGAEVIRFDQIGGGLDRARWPLAPSGESLFWGGLNKAKRSVELDLSGEEGKELATRLITAPGEGAGIFLTNFPATGWLDYERLAERRPDLIMVALTGNHDGGSEVDYTVNPATGFPMATGPRNLTDPLNSVFPAWDTILGGLAVVATLVAERRRRLTGEGDFVQVALSDVALASVGNLGRIAQATLGGEDQEKDGNYLYGAFGRDFETADGRRVMVVALTKKQWEALVDVTDTHHAFDVLENVFGYDLATESGRFEARELIAITLRPWFKARTLDQVRRILSGKGVSWGPYQTFRQLVEDDRRCSVENPMFELGLHPQVGEYLMPGSPLAFRNAERAPVVGPPVLGSDTGDVLGRLLSIAPDDLDQLSSRGVIGQPGAAAELVET